ncbi:MAG: PhaM family polyhydroxyalkanoate granule multifunctional regulatory protein [Pseudomonadota bacterium]
MTDPSQPQDPLEFLKSMWGGMGFPLPGMVTPTLDVGDLDKRIADLKAVEGWLKMNLNMLQASIQGLEMQRLTLAALQALGQSSSGAQGEAKPNPFANPTLDPSAWPWNFMQPAPAPPTPPEQPGAAPGKNKKK